MKNYDEILLEILNDKNREVILKILKDYLQQIES